MSWELRALSYELRVIWSCDSNTQPGFEEILYAPQDFWGAF